MDATVLGWIASMAFLARLLPQPIRLLRTRVPDGVSPLAALNATIADFGWIAYGVAAGLVPVWSVSTVAFGLSLWTVVLLRARTTRRDLIGAGIWLGVIVVAALGGALGAVLAGTVIVCSGPQVWMAVRERDLSGIAPATWCLAVVDASLWGAYGVVVGDGALVAYGVVMLASASTILGRIAWTRRFASRPAFAT